jgi:hypothetical protein
MYQHKIEFNCRNRYNRSGSQHTINTLRPRSGKEYEKIDRAVINVLVAAHAKSVSPVSSICSSSNANYVNITSVVQTNNSESPSPGYQSSTSFQEDFSVIKVCFLTQH